MVIVAVAGGTGAVGRTIVKALVDSGNHQVFLLSRSVGGDGSETQPQRVVANYNSVDQLQLALRQNQVEVVVSALALFDDEALRSQVNLIRGAAQSGTVTKFIPSEYHLNFHTPIDGLEMLFQPFQLASERELERHPQLTWTLIRNGLFLDYLGMPARPKPTNLMAWCVFLDLEHRECVFPGKGDQTMIFTHSADLAAYIERLICLPEEAWPREALIAPNKLILRDLAKIVQDVTGVEFKVTYDAIDSIHQGQITQLRSNKELFTDPSWGVLYQLVEKEATFAVLSDGYNLGGTDLGGIFPDIETTDLKKFLQQSWEQLQKRS